MPIGVSTMEYGDPACDGFMTDEKDIPITMNHADCTPSFLTHPVKLAIALSHGGWRDSRQIAALTVAKMEKRLRLERKDIRVRSVRRSDCSASRVGEEVVEEF